MSNKLYVGNLSYSVRDDDLQQQFSAFGQVQSAKVMICLLYTSPTATAVVVAAIEAERTPDKSQRLALRIR